MTDSISKSLRSVRFAQPQPHLHLIPDELLIEVGRYLLPTTKLSLPSIQSQFANYKHPFGRRGDYRDYISFRESCHKVGYLLKPIEKEYEVEIKSKEGFYKWVNAPKEKLGNVIRLRLKFTLDPNDDVLTTSTKYWTDFISLLLKLPNLLELYFTQTPFCSHGKHGHTLLFDLPDPDESPLSSIQIFANEVKCRSCAEHLTRLTDCMPNLKHLKCTSQDSVAQQNTDEDFEPYDFMINISAPKLETLYLKYWDLDTFDNTPLWELHEGSPDLKKLVYSSHAIEAPHTLRQRAVVEARSLDGEWQFNLTSEKGEHLSFFGGLDLQDSFAQDWSQFDKMEEFDPGLLLLPVQYATQSTCGIPPARDSDPLDPAPSNVQQRKIVHPEEYDEIFKEAMREGTKIMKANWASLKKVYWWQDRNKRADSPTRDYLRWTAVITAVPDFPSEGNQETTQVVVSIEGPEMMHHDLTWSDEGTVLPDVEEPLDDRCRG